MTVLPSTNITIEHLPIYDCNKAMRSYLGIWDRCREEWIGLISQKNYRKLCMKFIAQSERFDNLIIYNLYLDSIPSWQLDKFKIKFMKIIRG